MGWKQGHTPLSFRNPCLRRGFLFIYLSLAFGDAKEHRNPRKNDQQIKHECLVTRLEKRQDHHFLPQQSHPSSIRPFDTKNRGLAKRVQI